ncbi:MAG: hypothetical protein K6C94_08045 [Candidatus Gastranaerophilales bacterium]|nr:hypothetical protein [Candidatus Gastranaerophilales bacterium]
MKKILNALLLTFLLINLPCFADDFHKYYKQAPSYAIKDFKYDNLNRIPINIKIIDDVTTKKNLAEGQKLIFLTTEDVVLTPKKVLSAGSRIIGTVETISKNDIGGIPANLIVGNLKIEYMPQIVLEGKIIKQGANRALWVRPLLPVLFYVRGGQAKIKKSETYTVYYTPKDL